MTPNGDITAHAQARKNSDERRTTQQTSPPGAGTPKLGVLGATTPADFNQERLVCTPLFYISGVIRSLAWRLAMRLSYSRLSHSQGRLAMFGFFKSFGKPKSKTDEVKQQIKLGMLAVMAAVGERSSARDLREISDTLCRDWLPTLPADAVDQCLPQVLAAFTLVAQSQISASNQNSKNAAVLISAAKFCVADVANSVGIDDLLVMRAAAQLAQKSGLEFYSSMLEAG